MLTSRQHADLEIYLQLLRKWQKTINLVAQSTLPDAWERHVLDSAQLLPLAPPEVGSWVDIGTGAGFPGMVIAILLKGRGATVHLVESDARKVAFLRTVSRETETPVALHHQRVEEVISGLEPPTVISARALAPLAQLLDWTAPIILKGTVGLFLKGQDVGSELKETPNYSKLTFELIPSETEPRGSVVRVFKSQDA